VLSDRQLSILGPDGRALTRQKAEAFAGASAYSSDLRGWWPSEGSADSDILPEQPILRRRSRDLLRNNGIANGAQQTITDNVLGCGLWLAPMPNYIALGRDRKWATEWRRKVKSLWKLWAESTACDAGESITLDGMATLIFNGAWSNGDGLALPMWMPRPQMQATRLQVIESDRLSNPNFQPNSKFLRGGIEINEYGAPQAYWIRNAHPGDQLWMGGQPIEAFRWTKVPAYTAWGRKRVVHCHDRGRAGQTRGVPALAATMQQFKVSGDFQRAYLKSAVVNAMIALVTESSMDQSSLVELLSSDQRALKQYQDNLANRDRSAVNFRDGLIVPLTLGEKLSGFTPGRPDQNYEPFITAVFRQIATGLNIPYELLMKDFSKTNYSSARASLLEAWRFFLGRRNWLGFTFYQPVYELWLEEMVNTGQIEAPDFYEKRAAWCWARWIGPGRGWVDPLKEAQAAELRMDIMVSTLEDECAEQGKDWEEVLEQKAEEDARMKELGLQKKVQPGIRPKGGTDPVDDTGQPAGQGRGDAGAGEKTYSRELRDAQYDSAGRLVSARFVDTETEAAEAA
jgi:lambda family phage portal protein